MEELKLEVELGQISKLEKTLMAWKDYSNMTFIFYRRHFL